MRISRIDISNFRSIESLSLDVSPFVCIIGHNNAGKSTILMALTLFRSGSSLRPTDFYDRDKDIVFRVRFDGVTAEALKTLADQHKEKISELIDGGSLTLVRRYSADGKGELRCIQMLPTDERYSDASLGAALKNKRGAQIVAALKQHFPEHAELFEKESPNRTGDAKELVRRLSQELSPDEYSSTEVALPTGIPQSVERLLPEVLYIPAVKDLSDELKTKEASSFGKIIRVLLDMVHETKHLEEVRNSFSRLDALLNRQEDDRGEVADNRLSDVRRIEQKVEGYIQEQFQSVNVELEIPPPDLKTIFSNAKIYLDDGVRTEVEGKGDGLKRAVLFALLRAFVELRTEKNETADGDATDQPRCLFLFEEPELYLHPSSQRVLYDALRQIAQDHQVCVCTHSPYFFSAEPSGTYVRLRKAEKPGGSAAPVCESLSVNLSKNISFKDAFQIICFENSNAAFFCDRVLLVEGDCDIIYMKHLALKLNPSWNFDKQNVAVVKVGGKGSFARYREFFESFSVDVRIVADLDAIADQFEKLGASEAAVQMRAALITEAQTLLKKIEMSDPSRSQMRDLVSKMTFRERYNRCKELANKCSLGATLSAAEKEEFSLLFAEEIGLEIRVVLQGDESLRDRKLALINRLRDDGIIVLSKGAIEEYYPEGARGEDKPSRALHACHLVPDRDLALTLSDQIVGGDGRTELEHAFEAIFA